MTIDNQIRDEKLQYDINKEADKISALSSGKIAKNLYEGRELVLNAFKGRLFQLKSTKGTKRKKY